MSGVRTRLPTRERDLVRMVSFATALYRRSTVLYAEMAKFGIVGATAAIIDLGGAASLHGVAGLGPLTAKVISTLVATVYSYLGNRFWAFRHRANHSLPREWLIFFALNGVPSSGSSARRRPSSTWAAQLACTAWPGSARSPPR